MWISRVTSLRALRWNKRFFKFKNKGRSVLYRTVFVIVTKVLLAQLLPSDMHDQHAVDHLDAPFRREDGHGAHIGAV